MMTEKTVTPCGCGARCGVNDENCYGEVSAVDESYYLDEDGYEDYYWIHACENQEHIERMQG